VGGVHAASTRTRAPAASAAAISMSARQAMPSSARARLAGMVVSLTTMRAPARRQHRHRLRQIIVRDQWRSRIRFLITCNGACTMAGSDNLTRPMLEPGPQA